MIKTLALAATSLMLWSQISLAEEQSNICDQKLKPNFVETLATNPSYHDHCSGSYYNWGQGRDGWGYCYEWTCDGYVLNNGQPQSNYNCDYNNPSRYDWGRGRDGWGYCYQWTPYGVAMNQGAPQSNYNCDYYRQSYYAWGPGRNGYTHCYHFTAYGDVMDQGAPASDYNCR